MNGRPNLRFGLKAEMALPFQDPQELEVFREPAAASCGDPGDLVAAALRTPLEHPPLQLAVVPGDQIVIAVGESIPRCPEVLSSLIGVLVEHGVLPENLRVLLGPGSVPASQWRGLTRQWPTGVGLERHQAEDRASVAYLAATKAGHPVYINRLLCDADLVIIVSGMHPPGSPGNLGIAGSLYPTFADLDTMRRFFRRRGRSTPEQCLRESAEVVWLLGARFAMQIIPGVADQILHVIAGDIDAVARHGLSLARAAWSFRVERRADLVVTALEGGAAQQTWQNLYRSLEAAGQVVESGGAILACTELDENLDPQVLAGLWRHDSHVAMDQQLPDLDALQPVRLIPSLENIRIYLHSRLADELVEELGMIPVSNISELERICGRSQRSIVLTGGQHVWPELTTDSALVS